MLSARRSIFQITAVVVQDAEAIPRLHVGQGDVEKEGGLPRPVEARDIGALAPPLRVERDGVATGGAFGGIKAMAEEGHVALLPFPCWTRTPVSLHVAAY